MPQSEQHEPSRNGTPHGTLRGTSLATWLLLLMATAIMMIFYLNRPVLQLDEFRPEVGDIVVFRPSVAEFHCLANDGTGGGDKLPWGRMLA